MITAFIIGFLSGLRALTPSACIAWAAYLKRITLPPKLQKLSTLPAVLVLGTLAFLELIGDKLPSTPNRTSPPALAARLFMGALAGACLGPSLPVGAALGATGALTGTFVGFYARTGTVNATGLADLKVALLEDFLTLVGTLYLLSR